MCATDLRVDWFPRVAFPAIIQPMLCFRAYSPPPVLNACVQRRRRISLVVQASRSVEDDYHATIKALNSRDRRVPRKSLGQA
ncbi:hypothetical protein HPP92_016043 [Vanilla planifolia]|uniref:Uncharacterized protein n=1 Tax=Vanilla planifolia TaxID=51239 RepID=A0A835QJ00_VANPL|nr:hypothetical protein HPP92_016043 [Vanilla planifolia]